MTALASAEHGFAPTVVRVLDVDEPGAVERLAETCRPDSIVRLILRASGAVLDIVELPASDLPTVHDRATGPVTAPIGRGTHEGERADAALLSVVVTTCQRPELAARCVASLLACADDNLEIVVVENRPETSATRERIGTQFPTSRVAVVDEPVRGLSAARNTGLRHVRGTYIAYLDDDVVVDPGWCTALRAAFADGADCVTGLIVPSELASPVQRRFDELTAFSKGAERRTHRLDRDRREDPLFPFAAGAFGSGANTALRVTVARALRGFDTSLGAGTPARGGEDLDLYVRLLFAGYTLSYTPAAIVFHEHPDEVRALRRHAFDYGVGLSAMLTAQFMGSRRRELLRGVAAGLRHFLDPGSRKNVGKGGDYPVRLRILEILGLLWGPIAYGTSALVRASRCRRSARAASPAAMEVGHVSR